MRFFDLTAMRRNVTLIVNLCSIKVLYHMLMWLPISLYYGNSVYGFVPNIEKHIRYPISVAVVPRTSNLNLQERIAPMVL
jgi:hypothetical protein